jgi:hypothetical protein
MSATPDEVSLFEEAMLAEPVVDPANQANFEPPDEDDDFDPMAASLAEAEFTMRRLRRLRRKMVEVQEARDELLREAQEWAQGELQPLAEDAARAESWLASWMTVRLQRDPRAPKTATLPSGTVKSHAGSGRVEVENSSAFIAWAQLAGVDEHLVRQPEPPPPAPDKNAIRKALDTAFAVAGDPDQPGSHPIVERSTGLAIPGVFFNRDERGFRIEVRP